MKHTSFVAVVDHFSCQFLDPGKNRKARKSHRNCGELWNAALGGILSQFEDPIVKRATLA